MNNNPEEIQKFSALASQWWDREGPMKPLHQMNPARLAFVLEKTSLQNKRILDVGCGGGLLSEAMVKNGGIVTGLDLSPEVLAVAKEHAKFENLNITYILKSVEAYAQENPHKFDVVTCFELLEHVPDPAGLIAACKQLVKPQGLVFFSTIDRNLKSYLLGIFAAEYVLKILPKGTHQYKQFIRPAELCHAAEKAGLEFLDLKGMQYFPFKDAILTERMQMNYIAAFSRVD